MTKNKLSPVALGLSMGVVWGLSLFIMGLLALYFSYGQPFVMAVGTVYLGYQPTLAGSFIGAIIGFFDAFIGGFLIAWFYNRFLCSSKS